MRCFGRERVFSRYFEIYFFLEDENSGGLRNQIYNC